jgi:hypothetical protein
MATVPKPLPQEQQLQQFVMPRRWIIWDPIPDWLDLNREILDRLFVVSLEIEKEHLAVEQKKIDMVIEVFKR